MASTLWAISMHRRANSPQRWFGRLERPRSVSEPDEAWLPGKGGWVLLNLADATISLWLPLALTCSECRYGRCNTRSLMQPRCRSVHLTAANDALDTLCG